MPLDNTPEAIIDVCTSIKLFPPHILRPWSETQFFAWKHLVLFFYQKYFKKITGRKISSRSANNHPSDVKHYQCSSTKRNHTKIRPIARDELNSNDPKKVNLKWELKVSLFVWKREYIFIHMILFTKHSFNVFYIHIGGWFANIGITE